MYRSFRRKTTVDGITSIAFGCDGFALAHVISKGGERPRLEVSEYHTCPERDELEQTLGFALKANGLEGSKCVCLPRPGVYSLRQIEAPPVKGDELREAARWSIKDLVDFNIEDAVVDVFEVPQSEASDRPQRVYVVAANRPLIDETVTLIRRVGLKLEAIDILELALRNVSALLPQDEAGVALMYLGPDVSLLTITRAGSLYLARNIDADLEVLSTNPAFDPDDQKPDDFEEAGMMRDGLLLEAQRSLDYYEHQLGQQPVSTFFLAPTETPVSELRNHLGENLLVTVTSLDLHQLFDCKQPLPQKIQARVLPAIGAALRAGSPAP